MSFITKRDRVFNEYELCDLPSRNECKLKAYASCTDARAWSHFGSDKSEHLVDIIKRNNEKCRPRYVPTDVIVCTLMSSKNAEIARLKHRIEECEQLLAVYDQLDLSPDQKAEIGKAHSAIKAANKELDEMYLDLNTSGYTEGVDSESFQTGKSGDDTAKSRGDDWSPESERALPTETKGNQTDHFTPSDASTMAVDPRIDELKDALILKDAKLNAMHNTVAVMENDICEPFCIYAHIYTALEKIFGILCQNEKYRSYIDLLNSDRDSGYSDIKAKILFKLKILEKFCLALIAPCSQTLTELPTISTGQQAEIYHVETTFSLTSTDSRKLENNNKRAQLVADIIENEEFNEILYKEYSDTTGEAGPSSDTYQMETNASVETNNLNRLKSLQSNYDELRTCYENMKQERDYLKKEFQNYTDLEKECEGLRNQLREYNSLWQEKEHYQKRSEDLDSLKEQYLVLSCETTNLETQLKAENEINNIKSSTIEGLRNNNIMLEKKLNDASIVFEKEKNYFECKLKECECKIMCQDQQIKSLSSQIDRLLEHDHGSQKDDTPFPIEMINELESLKDQIKNLKDCLLCSDEEKQQLQEQFENKLKLINELRMEVEDWRNSFEKTAQRNEYLEKYTDDFRDEVHKLVQENTKLTFDVEEKTAAVNNLRNILNNKSKEVQDLRNEIEAKSNQNRDLLNELHKFREIYSKNISSLENEKTEALNSLKLVRQESEELLKKVESSDSTAKDVHKALETQKEEFNQLKNILVSTVEKNKTLITDLDSKKDQIETLQKENQRLRDINKYIEDKVSELKEEKNQLKITNEFKEKESEMNIARMNELESLNIEISRSQEELDQEKNRLRTELNNISDELEKAKYFLKLNQIEIDELKDKLQETEKLKGDYLELCENYNRLESEIQCCRKSLADKENDLENVLQVLSKIKKENKQLSERSTECDSVQKELIHLKLLYDELILEKNTLQGDFNTKTTENNNLCNMLESKIEENRELLQRLKNMEHHQVLTQKDIVALQNENLTAQTTLDAIRKESEQLVDKLKNYEKLVCEFDKLKLINEYMSQEKERLQKNLEKMMNDLMKLERENGALNKQNQDLMSHNEVLEKSLIEARTQNLEQSPSQSALDNVRKQIENLTAEKIGNQKKIRDLSETIETMDYEIDNLKEEVICRDDKIAILENHINSLEDEVRRLHNSLEEMVDTGEQMKDNSQKIGQSLSLMEAHHSKATHNMKTELAKLQNSKAKLEEQLSRTKLNFEEESRDIDKYISEINYLHNEKKVIVTEIQHIEESCAGESNLSEKVCGVDDILNSLDRIRRCLEMKSSRSSSLEQKLLKVQTSSQLLLSKADEAKKIVEKEKQKIIKEKEEAIIDRLNMENELFDLKQKLENQINKDKKVIQDLEAEITNQKLLSKEIKRSTQNHVTKLEEELKALQDLYQNALNKVNDLQNRVDQSFEENQKNMQLFEKTNSELKQKAEEVAALQKELENIQNKQIVQIGVQVDPMNYYNKDAIMQTDDVSSQISITPDYTIGSRNAKSDTSSSFKHEDRKNKLKSPVARYDHSLNEIQVLSAQIEPTYDFLRNLYRNHKIKRLSVCRLEQFDISSFGDNDLSDIEDDKPMMGNNLFDIYTHLPLETSSSKIDENAQSIPNPTKIGDLTGSPNNVLKLREKINNNYPNSTTTGKTSEKSGDLFIIYQDSDSNPTDTKALDKTRNKNLWQSDPQSRSPVEREKYRPAKKLYDDADDSLTNYTFSKDGRTSDGESIDDDEYLDSIESKIPNVSNDGKEILSETGQKTANIKEVNSDFMKKLLNSKDSHQRLFEIEPNFLFESNKEVKEQETTSTIKELTDFGLEYLLDAAQRENDPENASAYDPFKTLRRAQSDERLQQTELNIESPGKILRESTKSQDKMRKNLLSEKSVLANIDAPENYEEKIQSLTEALENIERYYKKKMNAIKAQYDNNIKNIINEHNRGVRSIQNLHEETLKDIIKMHENEVENLRSMSIEAMRKAEKLEKENKSLKCRIKDSICFDEEPIKIHPVEVKRHRKNRDTKMLSKTTVEAFNVKPKLKNVGPCTCSLDVNVSDTIRNLFDQVDIEQRKMAEQTYLKYVASKVMNGDFQALDAQELSFLHLKVCQYWKNKATKEEALQKKINTLEQELLTKQRSAQQHMQDLDRQVAEERRRLQEAREAVCRCSPVDTCIGCTAVTIKETLNSVPGNSRSIETEVRRSASELVPSVGGGFQRNKRLKPESNRAVLSKLDIEERRERKLYNDEPPTRLRRTHDRLYRNKK